MVFRAGIAGTIRLASVKCPSGLAFDLERQTCDWKAKVIVVLTRNEKDATTSKMQANENDRKNAKSGKNATGGECATNLNLNSQVDNCDRLSKPRLVKPNFNTEEPVCDEDKHREGTLMRMRIYREGILMRMRMYL